MTYQITIDDYFTGPGRCRRDQEYCHDLTDAIRQAAAVTVERVNTLLLRLAKDNVPLTADPQTGSLVHSGWRPPAVNAATAGAAKASHHMTGAACDLYDPVGWIDKWCQSNQSVLAELGLWLEHPAYTPRWCHVQTVAPHSGNRVFIP